MRRHALRWESAMGMSVDEIHFFQVNSTYPIFKSDDHRGQKDLEIFRIMKISVSFKRGTYPLLLYALLSKHASIGRVCNPARPRPVVPTHFRYLLQSAYSSSWHLNVKNSTHTKPILSQRCSL